MLFLSLSSSSSSSWTGEAPFSHSLVHRFHDYPRRPAVVVKEEDQADRGDGDDDLGPANLSVCLLEASTLKVYYEDGQDFLVAMPFEVDSVWSTRSTHT